VGQGTVGGQSLKPLFKWISEDVRFYKTYELCCNDSRNSFGKLFCKLFQHHHVEKINNVLNKMTHYACAWQNWSKAY